MKIIPLSLEERIAKQAEFLVEVTHADLTETTAATAQTLQITPAVVDKCAYAVSQAELREAFEDTADSANNTNTVEVGDGGDTDRFLAAMQVNKNATEVFLKTGTGTTHVYTSADTIDILFNAPASGKTLAALNKGILHVYFRKRDQRTGRN